MRILVVNTVAYKKNGITNVIKQYYSQLEKSNCHFDFVGINEPSGELKKCMIKNRSKMTVLSMRNSNPVQYVFDLVKVCKDGKYDAIHVHGNSSTMVMEMLAALLGGVRVRIAHAHSVKCNNLVAHKLLRLPFCKMVTWGFACSAEAGKFLFGNNKFELCVNAFHVTDYGFSMALREKYRAILQVERKTVIGYTATLTETKNHIFLLEVFDEYLKINPNAVLMLIGSGPYKLKIQAQIREKNLEQQVIMLGERDDVSSLINVFDYVVFPSKFEGLGIALIEAQANGVPVLASKGVIPETVKINSNFHFIPLEKTAPWVDTLKNVNAEHEKNGVQNVLMAGYGIEENAKKVGQRYRQLLVKNRK